MGTDREMDADTGGTQITDPATFPAADATYYAQWTEKAAVDVTFTSGDAELDAQFCKEATAAGLCNLKGHRVAGGMRASLYNAVTEEATAALVRFMADFEARH